MNKVFITDRIVNASIEKKILGDFLVSEPQKNITVLLVWHQIVDEEFLNDFPHAEVIIRYGVGFDKIDLEACRKRGITVCNNPDYCTEEVADTATAMLLNGARGVTRYNALAPHYRKGWQENVMPGIKRTSSIKVGFIGLGRIGSLTLKNCQAIGYQTQFFDPNIAEGYDKVHNTSRCYSLDELLSTSDMVSLHCPLNKHTMGMVNQEFINKMKPGASLINTARGQLVQDIEVIYQALKSHHLSYVALDVLPEEPPQPHAIYDSWRRNEPWLAGRLIINPHAAYHSYESGQEQRKKAAKNALLAVTGKKPVNIVS
ncbi:C-terminal binding protein [Endozoicomonas sp. 4G]|uniref:C-terminal binding protein n=1 Tax=Endozoicomonas sp. 4G TaxID=2872754 RepID=UPI0020789C84|nr:C-terminal binding protein [Endozoicomonas sp. 4G]